jgi:hypothetical protein
MATRRFTGTGRFEDREGNVLVVTSITAEIEPVAVGVGGSSCLSSPQQPEREGGVGETPDALFEDRAAAGSIPAAPDAPDAQEDPQDPVTAVWACYVETMHPRRTDLLPAERKLIQEALKAASVEECCQAIVGCSLSAFHMGDNDRRRKYNRLSQIIKGRQGKETTRERIDYFIDIFHNPTKVDAPLTSEAQFKINTLKDRVRRGNGNADGQKAEAELWERYRIETVWRRTERGDSETFAPVFERKVGGGQAA